MKSVKGYKGYFVTSDGQIISNKNKEQRVLKPRINQRGYYQLTLCQKNISKTYLVHKLVAETFLGKRKGRCINHKDGNKLNNEVSNLEFVSMSENIQHSYDNKLQTKAKGDENSFAKLSSENVRTIKQLIREGKGCTDISKIYGVHRSTINSIKRGDSWRHI